jgi:hypothetical protein
MIYAVFVVTVVVIFAGPALYAAWTERKAAR